MTAGGPLPDGGAATIRPSAQAGGDIVAIPMFPATAVPAIASMSVNSFGAAIGDIDTLSPVEIRTDGIMYADWIPLALEVTCPRWVGTLGYSIIVRSFRPRGGADLLFSLDSWIEAAEFAPGDSILVGLRYHPLIKATSYVSGEVAAVNQTGGGPRIGVYAPVACKLLAYVPSDDFVGRGYADPIV